MPSIPDPRLLGWGLVQLLRHGWPRKIVHTYVGMGDELLAASALRIAHGKGMNLRGTWFLVRYPALHSCSTLPVRHLVWDARLLRLVERLHRPVVYLAYSNRDETTGRDVPIAGHILANFCRQLGVTGEISLKPSLELTPKILRSGRRFPRQIVVQSGALGTHLPIPTKQWPVENMQAVVDSLRAQDVGDIIQLGTRDEPPLKGVQDLRGQLSLPEAAAVLAHSAVFIGLLGGLMHLARAVDCPSVIIYGGRESPELAGYLANENLTNQPACSPCYLIGACPHGLPCMHEITPTTVLGAVKRQLRAPRQLPVATARI